MELARSDSVLSCIKEPRLEPFKSTSDPLIQALLFIRNLAIKLRLSQPCVATAQIYFHTIAVSNSYMKLDNLLLAGACLFLASKALEQPRHLEVVCRKFYEERSAIRISLNPRLQVPPLSESMLVGLKQSLLQYEFSVLEAICFNVEIPLPYPHISSFVASLDVSAYNKQDLLKIANNFANDSFRTSVLLRKDAENVAAACLYLAANYLGFGLEIVVDQEIVQNILELYKTQ